MTPESWDDCPVLVTGHSGFKGAWLTLLLKTYGARVTGLSDAPLASPSLFDVARVDEGIDTIWTDLRDAAATEAAIAGAEPRVIFHLAAQPLVRESYRDPITTYATNVMGTAHVLDAARRTPSVRAVIVVTSDKCYENREWVWGYRENDPVGGHDPYSSSKGCAEILTAAWRRSFFGDADSAVIATVRAGNVIGGGDWAQDRLIPDCVRAADKGEPIVLRNPGAVRPWQFVLEPLRGYVDVAERCLGGDRSFGEAWNFGPASSDVRPVSWIVERFADRLGEDRLQVKIDASEQPHEAQLLSLDCARAASRLDWHPAMDASVALDWTADWYSTWLEGGDMRALTLKQIESYRDLCGAT